MKRKTIFSVLLAALFCFFSAGMAFGFNMEDLISREQVNALIAGDKPVAVQFKDPLPQLCPKNETLARLIERERLDLEPSVMVETLNLYRKPPEAAKAAMNIREESELFNGILALSTLTGLQYFSVSRGEMRTFYETSYVIDGPSGKKPIPDPVLPFSRSGITIYARQKDLTFGDNRYKYDYTVSSGALIFAQQNLTSLSYGIIPAIGRNKLRSIFAILDAEEYLLIYAVSMAKTASVPGMRERIGNSFTNRVEAVLHWFQGQADMAFKKANS